MESEGQQDSDSLLLVEESRITFSLVGRLLPFSIVGRPTFGPAPASSNYQ